MTFYMKPPRGLANVKQLEDTVRQRFTCYDSLFSENINEIILDLDCLAEDTVFDRLGHYIFRLVSLQSNLFSRTFLKNEVKLLEIRLNSYSSDDVKHMIKKLRKHAHDCLEAIEVDCQLRRFYKLLIQLSLQLLRKGFFNHAFEAHDEPCEQCQAFCMKVPFDFCLDLVASRDYDIHKGLVYVYSFKWKKLWLSLYKTYLLITLKEMKLSSKVRLALEDDRIKDAILLVKSLFSKSSYNGTDSKGIFTLESFKQEYPKFPLCMLNLYEILQKNNRLGHNARFDFSLYLKGIGLSLNDAFAFWENAYSKQHSSCSKCSHSWQENEKRYIYGIRHLYGLEGSRKNYSVKSCLQMQDMLLNATDEGGCPFRHFDDDSLRKKLKHYLPPDSDSHVEVIIHERGKNPKTGCELFFREYFKKIYQSKMENLNAGFQNPVQYYLLANSLI